MCVPQGTWSFSDFAAPVINIFDAVISWDLCKVLLTLGHHYDHLKCSCCIQGNFFLPFFSSKPPRPMLLLITTKYKYLLSFWNHSVQTAFSWCVEIYFELLQPWFGIIVWVVKITKINRDCVYTCMLLKITLLVLADR